jgi:hypothetical protein
MSAIQVALDRQRAASFRIRCRTMAKAPASQNDLAAHQRAVSIGILAEEIGHPYPASALPMR